MKRIFILLTAVCWLVACSGTKQTASKTQIWDSPAMWYAYENENDTTRIDVFYLVSTDVLSATDSLGAVIWQSQLTPSDREAITQEMTWVRSNMFYDNFRFVAPYYHQFTFNAIGQLNKAQMDSVYQRVVQEACAAFDYYMEHQNQGRPFVLAGFSQGAMLTLDVLRHMTDQQFERMVACYTLGYRLSDKDLQHPHIQAATGETDCGVVISFNSSLTLQGIWPFVAEGAAACINPVNWRTDEIPALFYYKGIEHQVHLDKKRQVLLVSTDDASYVTDYYQAAPFYAQVGVSDENLHHWDLLFYASFIHDNALRRIATNSQHPILQP